MSYNILSIDGGGIFGMHAAVVLDRIAAQFPDFVDKIDLITGTSIGGVLGLGLASGFKTTEIVDAFSADINTMFSTTPLRKVTSFFGLKSYYNNDGIKSIFTRYFGNKKLSELNKKIILQSFQINGPGNQWQSKVFHNLSSEGDVEAVYAGMATTAAPIYFPSVDNFVDGGVNQNNPAMTAIAMTQDKNLNIDHPKISDIKLLSIGRVYANSEVEGLNIDWGYLRWVMPLINILLTGNMTDTDYQCKQFLGDNYFRVNTLMPPQFNAVDDPLAVPALKKFSENIDVCDLLSWVKSNW
jgi:patatin-like phospholipase/acyl hydrolase